jgi:Mg2+ and Co2+ transporter CorA
VSGQAPPEAAERAAEYARESALLAPQFADGPSLQRILNLANDVLALSAELAAQRDVVARVLRYAQEHHLRGEARLELSLVLGSLSKRRAQRLYRKARAVIRGDALDRLIEAAQYLDYWGQEVAECNEA